MTKKDLVEMIDHLPEHADINFYLMPKDNGIREHSDECDLLMSHFELLYDGHNYDNPFVDIGLVLDINDDFLTIANNEAFNKEDETHSIIAVRKGSTIIPPVIPIEKVSKKFNLREEDKNVFDQKIFPVFAKEFYLYEKYEDFADLVGGLFKLNCDQWGYILERFEEAHSNKC